MGACSSSTKSLFELIKDGQPIAELLLKYYNEYDKMGPNDRHSYDLMLVEFLRGFIEKQRPAEMHNYIDGGNAFIAVSSMEACEEAKIRGSQNGN